MVRLAPGLVVLVRFPFSDLSSSKLRPAVVLASGGGTDWILCQITSKAYADPDAIAVSAASFSSGGLDLESFARPGKLFTANEAIVAGRAGVLTADAHLGIVDAVVKVLKSGVRSSVR